MVPGIVMTYWGFLSLLLIHPAVHDAQAHAPSYAVDNALKIIYGNLLEPPTTASTEPTPHFKNNELLRVLPYVSAPQAEDALFQPYLASLWFNVNFIIDESPHVNYLTHVVQKRGLRFLMEQCAGVIVHHEGFTHPGYSSSATLRPSLWKTHRFLRMIGHSMMRKKSRNEQITNNNSLMELFNEELKQRWHDLSAEAQNLFIHIAHELQWINAKSDLQKEGFLVKELSSRSESQIKSFLMGGATSNTPFNEAFLPVVIDGTFNNDDLSRLFLSALAADIKGKHPHLFYGIFLRLLQSHPETLARVYHDLPEHAFLIDLIQLMNWLSMYRYPVEALELDFFSGLIGSRSLEDHHTPFEEINHAFLRKGITLIVRSLQLDLQGFVKYHELHLTPAIAVSPFFTTLRYVTALNSTNTHYTQSTSDQLKAAEFLIPPIYSLEKILILFPVLVKQNFEYCVFYFSRLASSHGLRFTLQQLRRLIDLHLSPSVTHDALHVTFLLLQGWSIAQNPRAAFEPTFITNLIKKPHDLYTLETAVELIVRIQHEVKLNPEIARFDYATIRFLCHVLYTHLKDRPHFNDVEKIILSKIHVTTPSASSEATSNWKSHFKLHHSVAALIEAEFGWNPNNLSEILKSNESSVENEQAARITGRDNKGNKFFLFMLHHYPDIVHAHYQQHPHLLLLRYLKMELMTLGINDFFTLIQANGTVKFPHQSLTDLHFILHEKMKISPPGIVDSLAQALLRLPPADRSSFIQLSDLDWKDLISSSSSPPAQDFNWIRFASLYPSLIPEQSNAAIELARRMLKQNPRAVGEYYKKYPKEEFFKLLHFTGYAKEGESNAALELRLLTTPSLFSGTRHLYHAASLALSCKAVLTP